jgi:uncharacterized membrane protein YbhN (UPF0104 family)
VNDPLMLVPAVGAQLVTVVLYVMLWRALILGIDPARPLWLDSAAAFVCSWLARHAPTGVPYVASKVVLAERLGHKRTPVVASMVYENLFVVCAYTASSCVLFALLMRGALLPGVWLALGMLAAAVLAVLPLPATRMLYERLSRAIPRAGALASCSLSSSITVKAAAITLASAVSNGLAFAVLLSAFADLTPQEMLVAGIAFNLAGAAGVAAVPVPSGIGVREAVLIALLHAIVPIEIATAAAVTARALAIMLDLVLGSAGAARIAFTARRSRPAPAPSYSPSPLSSRPS